MLFTRKPLALIFLVTASIALPVTGAKAQQSPSDHTSISALTADANQALSYVRSLRIDAANNRFIVATDPLGPLRDSPDQDPVILRNLISLRSLAGSQPTLLASGFVFQDRILNGVPVARHEIVALQAKSGALCSGTLIDDDHVLTAYHCVCDRHGPTSLSAWFMVKNPLAASNTAIPATVVGAYGPGVNPNANIDELCENKDPQSGLVETQAPGRDMALLQLSSSVRERDSQFKAPSLMAYPFSHNPKYGLIAGYGLTKVNNSHQPIPESQKGLYATLTAFSPNCRSSDGCVQGAEFVSRSSNDSCSGDSGGPYYLVDKTSANKLRLKYPTTPPNPETLAQDLTDLPAVLVGVTSRSVSGTTCGLGGVYGAITANVLKWLQSAGAHPTISTSFVYE